MTANAASAILPPADLIGAMCYANRSAQENAAGRVAKTMNVPFACPEKQQNAVGSL
jgi:hypothetical protein